MWGFVAMPLGATLFCGGLSPQPSGKWCEVRAGQGVGWSLPENLHRILQAWETMVGLPAGVWPENGQAVNKAAR